MKINVHIEADDAEIRRYGSELLVKAVATTIREVASDPAFSAAVPQGLMMVMQGVALGQQAAAAGAAAQAQHAAHAQPAPAPADVGPHASTPDRCVGVGPTLTSEAGTVCCRCAAFNGDHRTQCRQCGHRLCNQPPVVTPAPEADPASALPGDPA